MSLMGMDPMPYLNSEDPDFRNTMEACTTVAWKIHEKFLEKQARLIANEVARTIKIK
jgi:hypothetical protein